MIASADLLSDSLPFLGLSGAEELYTSSAVMVLE